MKMDITNELLWKMKFNLTAHNWHGSVIAVIEHADEGY